MQLEGERRRSRKEDEGQTGPDFFDQHGLCGVRNSSGLFGPAGNTCQSAGRLGLPSLYLEQGANVIRV